MTAPLSPTREAEITDAYRLYCERASRNPLAFAETLSEASFRYVSLTREERITLDHGAEALASLQSGRAVKGTFGVAFNLAQHTAPLDGVA